MDYSSFTDYFFLTVLIRLFLLKNLSYLFTNHFTLETVIKIK